MRYFVQKFVQLLIVVVAVTFLTSLFIRLIPGDPINTIAPNASPEQRKALEHQYGLDQSIPVQYVNFVRSLATGDLGTSITSNTKVSDLIKQRLPTSLLLMAYAQLIALFVAIPLGVWAGYRSGRVFDRGANTVAFAMLAAPTFVVGVVLSLVFAVHLGWFPATSQSISFLDNPVEHFQNFFLPTITLAIPLTAGYMRLMRADMITTLQNDYVLMARAKGMSTSYILFRHALRPSLFSLVTSAAVNTGALIGGAFIVEFLFQMNGMGLLSIDAIGRRDYIVLQVVVAVSAIVFVTINFLVDMLYVVLDPRVRDVRALA